MSTLSDTEKKSVIKIPALGSLGIIDLNDIPPLSHFAGHGFKPKRYYVIIATAPVKETTSGGIILAASVKENAEAAFQVGRLVAKSKNAFVDLDDDIELGEVVTFSRYAGTTMFGLDGNEYRICTDSDIHTEVPGFGA